MKQEKRSPAFLRLGPMAKAIFEHSWTGFSLCALLLIALPMAVFTHKADASTVVLEGFVTDRSTGLPIAGASVLPLGLPVGPVATDATGFYSLTGDQLGSQTSGSLLFQADGYFAVTRAFSIVPPLPVRLDVDLLPGGPVLQGVVRNAATTLPIPGASVRLGSMFLVPGPTQIIATTDAGGFYSFDSSRFVESAASGFNGSITASAPNFLTPPFSPFSVSPPFPGTKDIGLISLNEPPSADAGGDQVLECESPTGATVTLDGSGSSDLDGDPLSFEWRDASNNLIGTTATVGLTLPLGTHTFTLTVDDGQGGTASDSVVITVLDTTAPMLSFTLTPNVLFSPNHKLVEVTASIQVSDLCDPNPSIVLVSIISNEPDDSLGDGDTTNDIQGDSIGTDDRSFLLRAERAGIGTGRIYTVRYRAMDASGNMAFSTAEVTVPHN